MNEYKDFHKGEDIYVIASGKSLDFIEPEFFNNKITIGINQVFKKINCMYLVRKEAELLKDCVEKNKQSIFFISKGSSGCKNNINEKIVKQNKYSNVILFNHNPNNTRINNISILFNTLNLKENELIVSYSTITSGIHLAAHMGAKNIIIVGHDCGLLDGEVNFRGYHTDETYKIVWKDGEKGYSRWITKSHIENDTIELKKILKDKYGCNIYSLNPFINFGLEGHKYER